MDHYTHTIKKINVLLPYPNNARTHTDTQIKQIAASIKEWGFTNPILIDEDNGIIAGHGRLEAAKKLGLVEVPCIILAGLTEAQKKAYVLADNQLALNAGWDDDLLKLEIENLKELDFDVDLLGFEDDFIDGLLFEETEGLTDEDAVPEPPEEPITKPGDVWILGNHRLMCGDSTSIDAVQKLMDGNKADLLHTDPPYGIGIDGDRSNRTTKGKDFADGVKYESFDDGSIDAAVECISVVQSLGISRQVWWGANYYAHHLPHSNNWFVWDKRVEEKHKDTQSDCELAYVKSKWSSVRIFRHLWKGLMKDSERGQARVHPTQKPVALAEWVIDYYKDVGSVLDLFGGSGFNLIAAEKKGIKSYTMELTAVYCDVIIKRWQDYTGKQAIHEETGKPYEAMTNG